MLKDLWLLARPGIVAMVLFSMMVAACCVAETMPPAGALIDGLLGTAMVILGAVVLNQRLEQRSDAMMARTIGRPLPSGRLSTRQVTWGGLAASVAGFVYLALATNLTLLALAFVSWLLYVWAYTPLKSRSAWQTPVGAAAGAMPMLLGAAVVEAPWSSLAWALFGVSFFWQLPHAMAIAWRYREQFALAGVRLLTVSEPTGRAAAIVAVGGAGMLIPVSLAPQLVALGGRGYVVVAGVLGLGYLAASLVFLARRNDLTARWLLWLSLVYLPVLLVSLLSFRMGFLGGQGVGS